MARKCLGKTQMYRVVAGQVSEGDVLCKCRESVYETDGAYEWLSVYGRKFVYRLCVGFGGAYMAFSVYDFDNNRLSREVLCGWKKCLVSVG